jgi:hypothetical protein
VRAASVVHGAIDRNVLKPALSISHLLKRIVLLEKNIQLLHPPMRLVSGPLKVATRYYLHDIHRRM